MNYSEVFRIFLEILVDGPNWKRGEPKETAILLLPGKHQEYRVVQGAKLWPSEGKYFLVAGTRGDPTYSRQDIVSVVGHDSPEILLQGFAQHTLEQMQWCASLLQEKPEIKHIIVTTAAYHLPRCVLTLLEALSKASLKIAITPVPLMNPLGDSFAIDSTEDFISEIEKIGEYQKKGDVASLEAWEEYLAWRIS